MLIPQTTWHTLHRTDRPYTTHLTTFGWYKFFYARSLLLLYVDAFSIGFVKGRLPFYTFLFLRHGIIIVPTYHYLHDRYYTRRVHNFLYCHHPLQKNLSSFGSN